MVVGIKGFDRPLLLCPGSGSNVEKLRHELTPVCDTGTTGRGFYESSCLANCYHHLSATPFWSLGCHPAFSVCELGSNQLQALAGGFLYLSLGLKAAQASEAADVQVQNGDPSW